MHKKVKYIFCISTGRSGTDYLKTLFEQTQNTEVFHERSPIGNGKPMQEFLSGSRINMENIASQKVQLAQNTTKKGKVYVETNHCFIKGFGWIIPEQLREEEIGVVILSRNREKTAKSLLRTSSTPLTRVGYDWMITPLARNPLVAPPTRYIFSPKITFYLIKALKLFFRGKKIWSRVGLNKPKTPNFIIDYELDCCRWFVEETASLADSFQKQFPRISYYSVNLEDLNQDKNIHKMLEFFDLRPTKSLKEIVGTPTNLKQASCPISGDLDGFYYND